MTTGFVRLFGQGRDRPVQELVLQQAKGALDVGAILAGETAIQAVEQLLHDGAAFGLQIVRQARDDRAVAAAAPGLEEAPRLLLNDALRGPYVPEPVLQRLFADPFEVINVEHAGALAVVDARVAITRHGDVQNDQRPARLARPERLVAPPWQQGL